MASEGRLQEGALPDILAAHHAYAMDAACVLVTWAKARKDARNWG